MSAKPSFRLFLRFRDYFSFPHLRLSFNRILSRLRLKWVFLGLALLAVLFYEIRTSTLQARLFSRHNERLSYDTGPGRSPAIAFPRSGPLDGRLGYPKIAAFQSRLEERGYRVVEQARLSPELLQLIEWGISPPYREPTEVGLEIRGMQGLPLYRFSRAEHLLHDVEEIPPLVLRTLLFLENRSLEELPGSRSNPAIEWDRLLKAAFLYVGSKLGLPSSVQGGSTLAVQLEKFRHSPKGRTDSPLEKLRQVTGASLKAYREGVNTRSWRNQIIVDYFNSMPLAAAPGHGEIFGLGEGLYVWFGLRLKDALHILTAAPNSPGEELKKLQAFKQILALLVSLPAPAYFLLEDRDALEKRVNQYTRLLAKAGVIDEGYAQALEETSIGFRSSVPPPPGYPSSADKAANSVRTTLMEILGIANSYDLDRLHLEVESTIDVPLQHKVMEIFRSLTDPAFVKANGLGGERLLENGDPRKVVYSLLLVERTPGGNAVRVHADSLAQPLDFNRGIKLELGSTAKLRTMAHYLEVLALLYREFFALNLEDLSQKSREARDPLTQWAVDALRKEKNMSLNAFLRLALERRYSANPREVFFTGGGLQSFGNFDSQDDGRVFSLREAFQRSSNLVFIRLMRDLVKFHQARLPYDPEAVISEVNHPERQRLLKEIADDESRAILLKAYRSYRGLAPEAIVNRILRERTRSPRHLAIVFLAWKEGADEQALSAWLKQHLGTVAPDEVARLYRSYGSSRLNLADYSYLLGVHPLELWSAVELAHQPAVSWMEFWGRSAAVRQSSSAWLFQTRNRHAQDRRLRIRVEKDAFSLMAPYWKRLGFPFSTMVPSYATAIGNSSDRPAALAEIMGIIVNDGIREPLLGLTKLRFARGMPYETLLEPDPQSGQQVLEPAVARALKAMLGEVVELGTARRLKGAFTRADGTPVAVGGKTGSGDNRFETFDRRGSVLSSRATNRTAALVFYIGDRYFGVISAFVDGPEAAHYRFTSALPVALLKILAPVISVRLEPPGDEQSRDL